MGRSLDVGGHRVVPGVEISIVGRLWGKTLNQLGIDMLHNGRPSWVIWDFFLDAVAREQDTETVHNSQHKKAP